MLTGGLEIPVVYALPAGDANAVFSCREPHLRHHRLQHQDEQQQWYVKQAKNLQALVDSMRFPTEPGWATARQMVYSRILLLPL